MALVFKTPKTAINTTTRDIQNIKDGECPPCPECPEVELTTADVEYTENGSFTVTPESGFAGLSQVDITVNIDTQSIADEAYAEGEAAGIITGKAQGVAEQKAKLTSTTLTTNGTVTREDGWNEVTVNVPSDVNNQDKTVTPTTSSQSVTADSGYSGLGTVTVNGVTSAIDQNITAGNIKSGVTILGVTGTVTEGITPTGNINITNTDSTDVTNYATAQVVDANLTAGNIKSGTTILGVQGSYDPQPDLETKSVTYTANDTYTITPTTGKDGLSSVEVTVNVSGGGSSCVDLDSIGFTCNDLAPINADLPEIVALKTRLDNGEVINLSGIDSETGYFLGENLMFIPSGSYLRCSNAETALFAGDIVGANFNDSGNITNGFFTDCKSLISIRSFAPDTGIGITNTSNMFKNCSSLITAPTVDMSNVTNVSSMYNGCHRLTSGFATSFPVATDCSNIFSDCYEIQSFPALDFSSATSLSSAFSIGKSPTMAGKNRTFTSITTSNALTNTRMMFSSNGITTCPVFNTSNVTDFTQMFSGCQNLTAIPALDYGKGTTFIGFAQGCSSIRTYPLMDMHSATNIQNMMPTTVVDEDVTIGGFENLGKAFTGTNANQHTLDLRYYRGLSKQNVMNVINNLAAPDSSTATGMALYLYRTVYDLLDDSDIAIATDKGWSVVSA